MVVRRFKKTRKQRGSRTYGWGAGKKHRGAGNRGGRGNAGVGKRGGQKKTRYLSKGIQPIGKSGMPTSTKKKIRAINLCDLNKKLDIWVDYKKATKTKGVYNIDLSALGYHKLLGTGTLNKKVNIKVDQISKKAKEKLEKAGLKLQVNNL